MLQNEHINMVCPLLVVVVCSDVCDYPCQ